MLGLHTIKPSNFMCWKLCLTLISQPKTYLTLKAKAIQTLFSLNISKLVVFSNFIISTTSSISMGNKNSTISKPHDGQRAKVASTEQQPHYVVSMQRKHLTKPEVVSLWPYPTQQGEKEKPLCDDETFSNYIQHTKNKIRSNSNMGCHENQSYPAPANVAHGTFNNKESERDPFSDYIQNARKKLRMKTLSRNISSRG
ncbi:hypothetical protein VNO78_21268 [Psophocarpus tetragonolobus]|uniref:Uncharacterized protein n=1 Tax=Psophocarpus tetragonolobus TaxID=3891 RepID=A0AAN9SBS8_PSOTE